MCKQIEEIMQLSDNGYIEEYDDIAVILEHFLNYTMEELNNALSKNHKILDFAADIAIRLGNIDITNTLQLEKITLSDLLCVMKYSEKARHESEEAILSYMKYLRNSIAYIKGLPWATLFMSISVNSLMSFFHEKTNDCKYSKIYREI